MIGGEQAGIAPMDMPSGWHNLGLTPVRPYAPERDPVFLFAAGDEIVFEPVDASRWDGTGEGGARRRAGRRGGAPMTDLLVKSCGPMTTLQDRGRLGYQGFGVSPSGAMDRRALAMANVLVGNAPETAAIEFMNLGGSFTCEGGDLHIALVGAGIAMSIDGTPVPPQTSAILKEGQSLDVGHPRTGTFAYLAIAGGFAVEPQLGSLSFHLRSRLGGLERSRRSGRETACPAGPRAQDREPMQLAVRAAGGGRRRSA